MPLQIRRGPTADRTSIVPLEGEIVYDTTLKAVYIGDGTTAGGIPVTLFSASDARTVSAQMFLGDSLTDNSLHSGITFQYVGNRLIATVSQDLTDYPGTIRSQGFIGDLYSDDSTKVFDVVTGTLSGNFRGDVYGSVFADDSTRIIDALEGSINLNGTVKGDIVPDQNEVYDLGSSSNRFKDLYLSGSSIYLGDAVITSAAGVVDLPIGSTIGGNPFGLDIGQTYEVSIIGNVLGEDSTVLVNAVSGSINLNGTIIDHVVPADSELKNLGDFTKKFKTLYLTEGANLYLGNAVISSSSTIIDLPAGSTVGGSPIGVSGGDVAGPAGGTDNALARFDGTTGKLIQNSLATLTDAGVLTTNSVVANLTGDVVGNLFGNVAGDVRGSVFGDDSSVIVDATENRITATGGFVGNLTGSVVTNSIKISDDDSTVPALNVYNFGDDVFAEARDGTAVQFLADQVNIGSGTRNTTLRVYSYDSPGTDTTAHFSFGAGGTLNNVSYNKATGSASSPGALSLGNLIYANTFRGWDGTGYTESSRITAAVDGNVSTGIVPGSLLFQTFNDSGELGTALKIDRNQEFFFYGSSFNEVYNDGVGSNGLNWRKYRGTAASPAAVQAGDYLGRINFFGYDGSDSQQSGQIRVEAEGTIGSGFVPGTMKLLVANSSGSMVTRLTLASSGTITAGGRFQAAQSGITLTALTGAPGTPQVNTFYLADGVSWDPAGKSGAVAYPVFYDGSSYHALY